jgi:hypothetical protein
MMDHTTSENHSEGQEASWDRSSAESCETEVRALCYESSDECQCGKVWRGASRRFDGAANRQWRLQWHSSLGGS